MIAAFLLGLGEDNGGHGSSTLFVPSAASLRLACRYDESYSIEHTEGDLGKERRNVISLANLAQPSTRSWPDRRPE